MNYNKLINNTNELNCIENLNIEVINIFGDWGLGIGDWGLAQSPIPNPQSPIPNPQSPIRLRCLLFII